MLDDRLRLDPRNDEFLARSEVRSGPGGISPPDSGLQLSARHKDRLREIAVDDPADALARFHRVEDRRRAGEIGDNDGRRFGLTRQGRRARRNQIRQRRRNGLDGRTPPPSQQRRDKSRMVVFEVGSRQVNQNAGAQDGQSEKGKAEAGPGVAEHQSTFPNLPRSNLSTRIALRNRDGVWVSLKIASNFPDADFRGICPHFPVETLPVRARGLQVPAFRGGRSLRGGRKSLRREIHAAQEVLKSRVGAQGVECGVHFQHIQVCGVFRVSLLQPS